MSDALASFRQKQRRGAPIAPCRRCAQPTNEQGARVTVALTERRPLEERGEGSRYAQVDTSSGTFCGSCAAIVYAAVLRALHGGEKA